MTYHAGILNDKEMEHLCRTEKMIAPFESTQKGKPSYGLGSFGYDIRLGYNFLMPVPVPQAIIDPLDIDDELYDTLVADEYIEMLPHSMILAESMEAFKIPSDIMGVCWGKSTYARCGVIVNVTPLEPGWEGVLTIEITNTSPLPVRLYVGQGIAQLVFFRGEEPLRGYANRESGGIYQNQEGVLLPQ